MSDYSSRSATLERTTTATTWDYCVHTFHARQDEMLQNELKELGRDGWELLFITVPLTYEYKCVFRRPL